MIGRLRETGELLENEPTYWRDLDTPALLVERSILNRNITDMQMRADRTQVVLRPHVKTHKCLRIVSRQLTAGAIGVTVAKLDEASVMIEGGVGSVLLANQVVTGLKIARAIELSRRAELILGVDSREGIERLAAAARDAAAEVKISIEIDCGLRRCGVAPSEAPVLASLIHTAPFLRLIGVFTHGGHAYAARSHSELEAAAIEECEAATAAARAIRDRGHGVDAVSIGSTPTSSKFRGWEGVTEIRPGNYVFNDAIQLSLDVATIEQCALTVLASVISRPSPTRAVIDAGSKTFGLDQGAHSTRLLDHFGDLVSGTGRLTRLSEEHGVLEIAPNSSLRPGDVVRILPNHACVAANLAREFCFVEGEEIVDRWPIDAAGGSR